LLKTFEMSLRGPKGRGNLFRNGQKKPSLFLRLLRFARNDEPWPDVFNRAIKPEKASFMQSISLLFGENNYKSLDQRKCLKNKTLPDTG